MTERGVPRQEASIDRGQPSVSADTSATASASAAAVSLSAAPLKSHVKDRVQTGQRQPPNPPLDTTHAETHFIAQPISHTALSARAEEATTPNEYRPGAPDADSPEAQRVRRFSEYCAKAVGFILMEDLVFHATSPSLTSRTALLSLWHHLSCRIAHHARASAEAMLGSPLYAPYTVAIFRAVREVVLGAVHNVRSVELSPLVLSRTIESMSDGLVSWWLQATCADCTQYILSDTVSPLRVTSESEFADKVARFHLHRATRLELPVPRHYDDSTINTNSNGNSMELPFCAWVSAVGDSVLSFLTQCYRVLALDDTRAIIPPSELNNTDDLLLKYISVVFRAVSETLQSQLRFFAADRDAHVTAAQQTGTHATEQTSSVSAAGEAVVVSYALMVTSCACMPVLVSCAEQQFVVNWAANYGAEEDDEKMWRCLWPTTAHSNEENTSNSEATFGGRLPRGETDTALRQQLGEPHLLAHTAAFFSPVLQTAMEGLLRVMNDKVEDRLRVTATALYWHTQVLRRASEGSRTGDEEQTALAWTMRYVTDVLPRLARILQRTVLYSVVGTVIAQAAMLMQSNIEKAIREGAQDGSALMLHVGGPTLSRSASGHEDGLDMNKDKEGYATMGAGAPATLYDLLRACVEEFRAQCEVLIPRWQATLQTTLPDLTAVRRFPLQVESTVEDLMRWLQSRRQQLS